MPTTSTSGKSRTAARSTMRPMRPKPLMPTLTVISFSWSCGKRSLTRGAGARRGQPVEIAPAVAGFDQVEPVPLEGLLDDERGTQALIECPRAAVRRDDPGQQSARAVPALRGGDRR